MADHIVVTVNGAVVFDSAPAQAQPVPEGTHLNVIAAAELGVPVGTFIPAPVVEPAAPTASSGPVGWSAFDGAHPAPSDFTPGHPVTVTLTGEPAALGGIVSLTRQGPDANFTATAGIFSGNSNDWDLQYPPSVADPPITIIQIDASVATRYGWSIRRAT